MTQLKSLENRCRRTARRRGYELRKDGQRDPLGTRYGKWYLFQDGKQLDTFSDIREVALWMGLAWSEQ